MPKVLGKGGQLRDNFYRFFVYFWTYWKPTLPGPLAVKKLHYKFLSAEFSLSAVDSPLYQFLKHYLNLSFHADNFNENPCSRSSRPFHFASMSRPENRAGRYLLYFSLGNPNFQEFFLVDRKKVCLKAIF